MEHTVKKNRNNRIAMRILAIAFVVGACCKMWMLLREQTLTSHPLIVMICALCTLYGGYLFVQSCRTQAYDITYVFGDRTLTLRTHRGEKQVSYDQIRELGFVVPDPDGDSAMIQIFIGKQQFVIPFTEHKNVAEALYGMLKLKKEEAEGEKENADKG